MTENRNIHMGEGNYNEYEQKGNFGIGHMSGGEIKGNAKVAVVINEAEEQDLAEAAAKIQALLEQLSETYPTTTSQEKNLVVAENSYDDEKIKTDKKSLLIEEIVTQGTEGRDLSDADLRGADLRGADLRGADLRGADLSDANLKDADLIFAHLRGANLRGANLGGANLGGANLSDVNLQNTIINENTKLNSRWHLAWDIVNNPSARRYLSDVDLSGINLRGAALKDADLSDANLNHTDLRDANLIRANLSGAVLIRANLSGADLRNAKVENTRFADNPGISESLRRDLIAQGAVFEDSPPGERSGVLTTA